MLASIGHDDIQYWLGIKENRDEILNILRLGHPNFSLSTITKEYRKKLDYQAEIFIDIFEIRKGVIETKDECGKLYRSTAIDYIIWEIKPVLANLGETLRQLRKYRQIMASSFNCTDDYFDTILVYNTSLIKHEIIKQYFEPENIYIYQVSALKCSRLEVLK